MGQNTSQDVSGGAEKATPDIPKNTKKLFIKTYGCQMNVYDSERMREVLAPVGYEAD